LVARAKDRYTVTVAESISEAEQKAIGGNQTLANYCHFVSFSSPEIQLFFARVEEQGRLVAVAPVVRLWKCRATDMLKPSLQKWLGPWLGPILRKTTLLVDTAFLAYEYRSPFFCVEDADQHSVKASVSEFLKSQKDVDSVWITEPETDATFVSYEEYDSFPILPMVHVRTAGFDTMEEYVGSLSQKRRRNYRQEREAFRTAGATVEVVNSPLNVSLATAMYRCLAQSASRSVFRVPYNKVLTNEAAFRQQKQMALVARLQERVIGFMTFIINDKTLLQSHGGLDYDLSLEVRAYHNLAYALIEYAIGRGLERVSFGPLNNETKRRVGTHLMPVVASLWTRNPIDRVLAKKFFIRNFHVHSSGVS